MMLREWVRKGTRFQQISKVIAWIRRNYAKAFQIGALAKVANMSAASLHRHFKAVTRMSLLQYQKKIRLQEARRLLIEHAGDAASIGFSVGMEVRPSSAVNIVATSGCRRLGMP